MRFSSLSLVFLTVLVPISTVAESGNTLLERATTLSGALLPLQREEVKQMAEEALELQSGLLPLVESGAVKRRDLKAETYLTVAVEGLDTSFRDVPRDSWFAPFVRDVLEAGWMSGYRDALGELLGLFGPADPVTIEQLAKVAVEAGRHDVPTCLREADPLLNTKAAASWSRDYVHCAEALGLAVYSDGSVDPVRPALRNEVVVTMLQAYGVTATAATGEVFVDVPRNVAFASFIEQAAADGVVGGYTDAAGVPTGRFGPGDTVNRAALAKIVLKAKAAYAAE